MRTLRATLLILLCVAGSMLRAAEAPWMRGTYLAEGLQGMEVPIAELFREFSRSQAVPVLISDDVKGNVIIQYPELTPVEYLDRLTLDTGLIWYFDGAAIHVYSSTELQSVVFPLGDADADDLVAALKRLGVYSDKFPIIAEPEYGLLYVVGPSRYLEIIEKITTGAERRALEQAQVRIDVEVIPLRYAWADDQAFVIGDNQVAVPGVATILRNLLNARQGGGGGGYAGQQVSQIPYNLPSLRGLGLIRPENQALANAQQAAVNAELAARSAQAQAEATTSAQRALSADLAAQRDGTRGNEGASGEQKSSLLMKAEQQLEARVQAVIQPDRRTNSIIIKDVQERMETYRRIIRDLDQPGGLVEIKAAIVDLDANQAFQLGLPYHALWNDDGREHSLRANLNTTDLANLTLNPGNLTLSLMDNQVTKFFLNLQALETDGRARMVARPSVVTINNIEAYLDEIEEFYVKVPGFEQVDLFNIKVGTRLYVVPHIVQEPDGRRIKLNVRIEDGTRSTTASVDEIPVVTRNTINTQAVLLEGQSLLVGGLVREEETKTVKGVPLLGRLPKVGALFRENVHETKRIERLVLLTPTIIDLPQFSVPEPDGQPAGSPELPPRPMSGAPDATVKAASISIRRSPAAGREAAESRGRARRAAPEKPARVRLD